MSTMDALFPGSERVLLFACMKDKDYGAIINRFRDVYSEVIVTQLDDVRGASPETLYDLFSEFTKCSAEDDPEYAFHKANHIAIKKNALLVVSGSFYLAGLVYNLINKNAAR